MSSEAENQRQLEMDQQRAASRMARREAEEENKDNGGVWSNIASGVSNFLDDYVPDDSASLPIVGGGIKKLGETAQQTWDGTYTIASAGALSANPGYWDNRADDADFWNDASNTNLGVAAVAANQFTSSKGFLGGALGTGQEVGFLGGENIYDQNPGLNIANQQEQQEVFTGRTDLNIQSGVISGAYGWFFDPLVLVGKAKKLATVGSRAGNLDIVGRKRILKDQQGFSEKVFRSIDVDAEEAIQFSKTGLGRNSRLGVIGEAVQQGDYETLKKLSTFKGANRDVLASIGAGIDNTQDAIVFIAAAAGSRRYQKILVETQAGVDLALKTAARRGTKAGPYETRALNLKKGEPDLPILPNYLEPGVDAAEVIKDLLKRDKALRNAMLTIDEIPTGMIEQVGGSSVTGMKIAKAWRDGVLARKGLLDQTLAPAETSGVRNLGMKTKLDSAYKITSREGVGPAAFERIYQLSGAMPRIAVIDWIKGSHATGWIDIRGMSSGKGSDELDAVFSDTKILSKDRVWVNEQMTIYGAAQGPTAKFEAIKKIEQNAFQKMAKEYGINDPDAVRDMYARIDKARTQLVENFSARNYGIDPTDGVSMVMTPMMKTQLETLMPMLNMRIIEKSAKVMYKKAKYMDEKIPRGSNIGKDVIDEVMSLWKAGALLRLGYTIRNTVEGWARSAVYLGTIPGADQLISGMEHSLFNNARRVEGRLPSFFRKDSTKLVGTKALLKEEDRANKQLAELAGEVEELRTQLNKTVPSVDVRAAQKELAAKQKAATDLQGSLERLSARRERLGQRKKLGDNEAFGGELNAEYGDLYRRLSSAERTNSQFLNSRYMRQTNDTLSQNSWGVVKPTDPQYWDELATAARQMRGDDIASRLLKGEEIGDIVKWAKSAQGRLYRRDLKLAKEAVENRVVFLDDMIKSYFPTEKARNIARTPKDSPAELRTALGGLNRNPAPKAPTFTNETLEQITKKRAAYDKKLAKWKQNGDSGPVLSDIHGRKIENQIKPSVITKYVDKPIERVFKALGTYPESTLVRHPFYNEVWKRNMVQQQKIAKAQGVNITEDLLGKMNTSAHKTAMRATNETLFTIERYSNPAAAMRWASPFFAAWENTAKVWTKMVVNDPSILARANMLWNIPEQLGMIVDREGNPVEGSLLDFLKGSEDQYLTVPAPFAEVIQGKNGGAGVRIPRGSLNVISPGETSWLPGFGPLVVYPVGLILARMPDKQKMIRDAVGDQIYNQIAPFGVVNDDLVRNFVPAWARQAYIGWKGESDAAYLKTTNAMMQIAMVDWYKSGGLVEDKPDMDTVLQMTNDFYRFTTISRLTLPFTTSRTSPYQMEIDAWNMIKRDTTLTYAEKVESFVKSYGADFMPLTVSGSDSSVPGIQSTQETYKILNDHKGLARELAETSPEAVGMLANSAPVGEFDSGVYKWMGDNNVPGLSENYRGGKQPWQMSDDIIMASAWRDYRKAKEARDEALTFYGFSSMEVKGAAGIKQMWKGFKDEMVKSYGNTWVEEFNGWQDQTASNLSGITKVLGNSKFMADVGSTPRWQGIATYMEVRQDAMDAIAAGMDSADVKEMFGQWVSEHKYSSLEFNDFFERYLDQDELLNYGIGFLDV